MIQYKPTSLLPYAVLLLFATLLSCKKPANENAGTANGTPLQSPKGAVIGSVLKKTIGVNGGILAFPDQYITLSIPAGAVESPTEFSIQEVERNSTIPTGRVFRILPENALFKKPVQITFAYSAADIEGSDDMFLYPYYQESDGKWHRAQGSILNKTAKTLTVSTTHFSDWAPIRTLGIYAPKYDLVAGETISLQGVYVDENEEEGLAFAFPLTANQVVGWKVVSGGGKLSGQKSPTPSYTAPNTNNTEEAYIELNAKNIVSKTDPDRPGTSGLVIVRQKFTIGSPEFVKWDVGGVLHEAEFFTVSVMNGQIIIGGQQSIDNVSIVTNRTSAGTSHAGNMAESNSCALGIHLNKKVFSTGYFDCSSGNTKYGDGHVVVSKFAAIGEMMEGSFQGTVYYSKECSFESKKITGTFRVIRRI